MSAAGTEPVVVVATTVEGEEAAEALARAIVGEGLAACVQRLPVRSVYRWQGAVESAAEVLLLAKTRAATADALVAFVRGRHAYELPEIVVTPVTGGLPEYLAWVADNSPGAARPGAAPGGGR